MVKRLALEFTFILRSQAAALKFPKTGNPEPRNDAERVFLVEVSFPVGNSGSNPFDAPLGSICRSVPVLRCAFIFLLGFGHSFTLRSGKLRGVHGGIRGGKKALGRS